MDKPANQEWITEYIATAAVIKHVGVDTPAYETFSAALTNALRRIYRAVALDIDGTLTPIGNTDVTKRNCALIRELLQRGLPVILVTGRGRGATRKAADQIRDLAPLSSWYLRRLLAVTHNGNFLLKTPSTVPDQFLASEQLIAPMVPDLDALVICVRNTLAKAGLSSPAYEISPEPNSVRMLFRTADERTLAIQAIDPPPSDWRPVWRNLITRSGCYRDYYTLDLTSATKCDALNAVALMLGERPDRILRIGDQGHEDGNDFDLLDSSSGFSVDRVSQTIEHCFPVVSVPVGADAASATESLLDALRLLPSISLPPAQLSDNVSTLRGFERLALARSRIEAEYITARLRLRLRYLFPDSATQNDVYRLTISDIFDPSGGIRLDEHEGEAAIAVRSLPDVFGLAQLLATRSAFPQTLWSMYTDESILLRGPAYYIGFAELGDQSLQVFRDLAIGFVDSVHPLLEELAPRPPDMILFKLIAAAIDNVRNILLRVLNAILAVALRDDAADDARSLLAQLHERAMLWHTRFYYRFLFDPELYWQPSLLEYCDKLAAVRNLLKSVFDFLADVPAAGDIIASVKWREADHFVENVAAVHLGLHELRQAAAFAEDDSIIALGLANGGTELPWIAAALSAGGGVTVEPWLAHVSIYSRAEVNDLLRRGEYERVAASLLESEHLASCTSSDTALEGRQVILFDDNVTTATTLQLTRDLVVLKGGDPVGAVVVRFPGVNRREHMGLHGFPDPHMLFGFVRGLVSASPYARLSFPGEAGGDEKKQYQDVTGVFDKAKRRIQRYLVKNGDIAWSEV